MDGSSGITAHLRAKKQKNLAYLNGCASSVGGPFCSFVLKIRIGKHFSAIS